MTIGIGWNPQRLGYNSDWKREQKIRATVLISGCALSPRTRINNVSLLAGLYKHVYSRLTRPKLTAFFYFRLFNRLKTNLNGVYSSDFWRPEGGWRASVVIGSYSFLEIELTLARYSFPALSPHPPFIDSKRPSKNGRTDPTFVALPITLLLTNH